jgi:hypothetical protein
MQRYGEGLAAIHAASFAALAVAGPWELLRRLPETSLVVGLGWGDGTAVRLLSEGGPEVLGIATPPPGEIHQPTLMYSPLGDHRRGTW